MTPSIQQSTSASQGFPCYEQPGGGYDLHQDGESASQIFPCPQFSQQAKSSPGTPPGLQSCRGTIQAFCQHLRALLLQDLLLVPLGDPQLDSQKQISASSGIVKH